MYKDKKKKYGTSKERLHSSAVDYIIPYTRAFDLDVPFQSKYSEKISSQQNQLLKIILKELNTQ